MKAGLIFGLVMSMGLCAQTPQVSAVLNSASGRPTVSPGSLVTIFGSGFGVSLSAVTVTVDGRSAPVRFVSDAQINIQVPADVPSGQTVVRVRVNGVESPAAGLRISAHSPAIFTLDGTGTGTGMFTSARGLLSGSQRVQSGETVTAYVSGLGAEPRPEVSVTVGGLDAAMTDLAADPSGIASVTFIVPQGLLADPEVVVTSGGESSPPVAMPWEPNIVFPPGVSIHHSRIDGRIEGVARQGSSPRTPLALVGPSLQPEATSTSTGATGASISFTCDATVNAVAGVCNTLNSTIAGVYSSTLTNAGASIYITFGSTGLGQSNKIINSATYTNYRNALIANQTSANDSIAINSSVPLTNPYGSDPVALTNPQARVLGFPVTFGVQPNGLVCSLGSSNCYDGVITVSSSFLASGGLYFRSGPIQGNQYDFYTVVEHEANEILGTSSCAFSGCSFGGGVIAIAPADLYRYHSNGTRAFATAGNNNSCTAGDLGNACFSLDGVHMLQQYNNVNNGEDTGDWATNCAVPLVQNAAACPGVGGLDNSPTAETLVLDVVGFGTAASGTPDLTISKTHSGNFTQGQSGATYTITVSNSGAGPTSGTVTMTETVPTGLTATAISGTSWNCTQPAGPCSRSDVLANGSSYPALTLTVNVAINASSSVTNIANVSGGGETNTSNNQASDPTTINPAALPVPDLTISKTHTGNFTQGQTGASYTITARNSGTASTNAAVSVTESIPTGLTATAISGSGWNCTQPAGPCSRSDALGASSSYPAISVTVNVAANAAGSVTNTATVSGGGETNTGNDQASDPTTIIPLVLATSIWPSTAVPATTFVFDSAATLGVKFRSDLGGTITGIRYYKGLGTADTRIGLLYSSTGTLLAQATFVSPQWWTTGWQQVNFSQPVSIAANTTYVAAYYSPVGYALNTGGFSAAGVDNPPLHALRSGVDGINGVLSYGSAPQFPTQGTAGNNYWVDIVFAPAAGPDLTIAKTHSGNFTQGQTGATYTITATNNGSGATSGTVIVTDTLPTGLTATAIAGSGWSCTQPAGPCNRSDALSGGSSYPAITLTVNVAANAPSSVINTASVSGGGETNTGNDQATDPTTVSQLAPDLTITKTHTGSFTQGQTGATYSITARNSGTGATSGTVTVTENVPAGLTATAIGGNGWNCTQPAGPCSRSDVLAASSSYPVITLTVNVSASATSSVTNTVSVSGGGETNTGNDQASDPTTIIQLPDLTISKTHSGNFTQGQSGATYTITVSNSGTGPTSGTVTMTETVPTGLTATAISGTSWNCTQPAGPCSRSDVLANGSSYPALTLTVNVAINASSSVTNIANVSGGGETNTSNNQASDPTTINPAALPVPDLTISKTHTGNFTQGQTGASYTITARNSGTASTNAAVSVTESLPVGLTATAISGSGWNCTQPAGPCSRSDALGASSSYPAISVTVNVAANAAGSVTNTATVSGGGETNTGNDQASDPTTIIPLVLATSIWPSTAVPATTFVFDSAATLGVKFRSDLGGTITGIRYYKGLGTADTRIGLLYSSTGTLLAQATFVSPQWWTTGWQQVNFSQPVSIAANTTYVAAFYSQVGYSLNSGGFSAAGVDNPPLHALRDGVDGPNGVITRGTGPQFPNTTAAGNNYWVDIVFAPGGAVAPGQVGSDPADPGRGDSRINPPDLPPGQRRSGPRTRRAP